MRNLGLLLVALAVFAGGLAARLPLGLVTDRIAGPVAFGAVSGTLWDGQVRGLSVNGETLGDARVRLRFLPLLKGLAVADLAIDGRGLAGAGTASFDGDLLVLENARGQADLARFGMIDAFGQTLRGDVEADIERLAFSLKDGCRVADLTARTDALSRSLGVYAGRGFPMSGEGHCDGDVLVIPLAGEGAEAAVRAELRIDRRGRYVSRLAVEPAARELGAFLEGMGFRRDGRAFVTERSGMIEANL